MEIKERIKLNKITHSVRASQAVLQYGVGAMVDFPEQTLMTAAPETWSHSVMEIHDERLEKALDIDYIGMPGSSDEAQYHNGISYTRFPEWYFCPKCRSFKPLKEWIYDYAHSPKTKKSYDKEPYMVKRLRCPVCFQDLVVARIVTVCGHGHIDDFPWVKWVHAKNSYGSRQICKAPKLKFTTSASSTEGLEGLTITCTTCNARTTLKGAFDKDALKNLDEKTGYEFRFKCAGRHPWKNSKETCEEYPHVMQRGSSSVYFPVSWSSLVIPPYSNMLTEMVQNSKSFPDLRKAINESLSSFKTLGVEVTQEMKEALINSKIDEYSGKIAIEIGKNKEQVKTVLERRWKGDGGQQYSTKSVKYKAEEYVALNGEVVLEDMSGEFVRESVDVSEYNIPFVKNISLVHKVREVQALIGFSRLEPVDKETENQASKIQMVDIKEKNTDWYPGYELRGEGIFIEFDEEAINRWRNGNIELERRVQLLNDNYAKSYYGSKKPRVITSKFVFLHTISHLLMKQLSFECGYNIASLKERLYCSEPSEGRAMAGIFIYTASGDSEGTLGGLVRQGRADTFPEIFKKAIDMAMTCSNDPVCSLSQGQGRDSLNLSACYSCTLVPETSCEELNVFLDRGMIIGTFENPMIGMYSEFVHDWKKQDLKQNESQREEAVKEEKKKNNSNALLLIKDLGVKTESYKSVWENLIQFADDEEKNKISDLLEHSSEFEMFETPGMGGTFSIVGHAEDLGVDLIWNNAKLLLFTKANEEEYLIAKKSGWKCFYTGETSFEWKTLLNALKGDE